jgi:hypothetical protein
LGQVSGLKFWLSQAMPFKQLTEDHVHQDLQALLSRKHRF